MRFNYGLFGKSGRSERIHAWVEGADWNRCRSHTLRSLRKKLPLEEVSLFDMCPHCRKSVNYQMKREMKKAGEFVEDKPFDALITRIKMGENR